MSRDVRVAILGDSRDFSRAVKQANDDSGKLQNKFAKTSDSMGKSAAGIGRAGMAAAAGLVGAAVGVGALAKSALDAGSDLNESMSKVDVVFKESAGQIHKWADSAASAMGMSKQKAEEAAGTFGNLFSSLGIANGPAADMSISLTQLASDLASFNNVSSDDALLALRSGLLGEAEPLRAFGVSLSAARIEAEALASGLVKPTSNMGDITAATVAVEDATAKAAKALKDHGKGSIEYAKATVAVTRAEEALSKATKGKVPELTAAQKAQAAYNVIQQDTALAQGDFARTSDGLANRQRILAARFEDVKGKIGQALIPIVLKLMDVFERVSAIAKQAFDVIFKGDFKGGPLAEDSPFVNGLFKVRDFLLKIKGIAKQAFDVLFKGDFKGGPLAEDSPFIDGLFKARDLIKKFVDFVKSHLPLVGAVVVGVFAGWAASALAAAAANLAAIAPFIAVGAAIAAVAAGIIWAYKHFDTFRAIVDGAVKFITGTVVPAIKAFAEGVAEQFSHLVDWVKEHWGAIQEAIGHVVAVIQAIINGFIAVAEAAWRRWGDNLMSIVSNVWAVIQQVIKSAVEVVSGIIETAMNLINGDWGKAWDSFKNVLAGAWDGVFKIIQGAIKIVVALVSGIGEAIVGVAGGLFDGVKAAFKAAINWIIDKWNALDFTIPKVKVGPISFGGQTIGLPDIPKLHSGGTYRAPAGQREGLALLRNGERVTTPERDRRASNSVAAGDGITLNFYGPVTSERLADGLHELRKIRMQSAA